MAQKQDALDPNLSHEGSIIYQLKHGHIYTAAAAAAAAADLWAALLPSSATCLKNKASNTRWQRLGVCHLSGAIPCVVLATLPL